MGSKADAGSDARRQLLETVEGHPGLDKSVLCRATGLGWGTLSYHLEVLQASGLVKLRSLGRQTNVFSAQIPDSQLRALAALRQGAGPVLPAAVQRVPGLTVRELAATVGASPKVVRRQLGLLGSRGLVRAGRSRPAQFHPAPRLLQALRLLGEGPDVANNRLSRR